MGKVAEPCSLNRFEWAPPCTKGVFLLSKELRSGYTTGSCAAAGVKAALHFYQTEEVLEQVVVASPDNEFHITVPIEKVEMLQNRVVRVTVIKDGGDDPDVTHGTQIISEVKVLDDSSIRRVTGGEGVGVVTRAGLSSAVGEAAINPGPKKMIERVLDDLLSVRDGVEITIQVPEGKRLAQQTLNPMLGIEGGISILGTDGIVRPMSEDAFKESLGRLAWI